VVSSATTFVRGAAGSAPWAWPWPSLSRMIRTMSAANSTAPRKSTMHPTHQKRATRPFWGVRSEEHTSELQSRFDLVCRLQHEKEIRGLKGQSTVIKRKTYKRKKKRYKVRDSW